MGAAVVRQAEAMLDVREATGHNDGPAVEAILATVDLAAGASWCGAFVYAAHYHAGVQLPTPARSYAWAPTWTAKRVIWKVGDLKAIAPSPSAKERGVEPGPGDVFGLWFANKGRVAHVGIVQDWQPGSKYLLTIEGNTDGSGGREGDGVYSRKRLKSQLWAVSRWAC